MKKLITATIIAATIIAPVAPVQAQAKAEVKVDLFVNNSQVYPDSPAYISNTNRTMVPISFVSQAFNFNTSWDARKQEVKIEANGKVVVLTIGSKYATVDGQRVEVDPGQGTAPVIRNSRTMVPVAFIASSFGVDYGWTAYPAAANIGAGRVNFTKAGFALPVAPAPNNLPLAPGGHAFEEGKALRPEDVPKARQTIGNNREKLITMTNAEKVKLRDNLYIYPQTLIRAKNSNGVYGIYMKAEGGGATTAFYYQGDKRVNTLMTGDTHNGWMLIGSEGFEAIDYLLFYGTEDKMVPIHKEITATFNQNIRTINANQF